jgi:flagellar biosynthesis/type III secretory pathway chaperone
VKPVEPDVRCGSDDPDVCRDYLAVLLGDETTALGELEELLKREHDVLVAQNIAAIERISRVRQEMMGSLARTEEQRRTLCAMHGHTPDWLGLERLMQWCDPQGSLLSLLRECAQRATRCRDANDRNGTLVTARLKQVEGMLAALTGGSDKPMTYGPKGAAAITHRSRELGAA